MKDTNTKKGNFLYNLPFLFKLEQFFLCNANDHDSHSMPFL